MWNEHLIKYLLIQYIKSLKYSKYILIYLNLESIKCLLWEIGKYILIIIFENICRQKYLRRNEIDISDHGFLNANDIICWNPGLLKWFKECHILCNNEISNILIFGSNTEFFKVFVKLYFLSDMNWVSQANMVTWRS